MDRVTGGLMDFLYFLVLRIAKHVIYVCKIKKYTGVCYYFDLFQSSVLFPHIQIFKACLKFV